MEILGFTDYRKFLSHELEKRLAQNPSYSLRAFARSLKITPQVLSQTMSGKRGISLETAAHLSAQLELSPAEASYFQDLVTLAHARSPHAKKISEYRILEQQKLNQNYQSIDMDVFKCISDWFHYGILELAETRNFRSDPKWIAARLDIGERETTQALERLERLGLIKTTGETIVKTHADIAANYGIPSAALRKHAKQMLSKASSAIDTQNFEDRSVTSMTMSVDTSKLPQAELMIERFRKELATFLEQGNTTEVYSFVPALFRLTKKLEN